MIYIIAFFVLLGYLLISTEHLTNINKSAVAMFFGVVAWVMFMLYGSHFVLDSHGAEYALFLGGRESTGGLIQQFIANNLFMHHVAEICEVVLFLLGTMSIVEVLESNGCFDFLREWLRTRNSRVLLWGLVGFTYILSANIDNLTTTAMMLVTMNALVQNRVHRRVYGAAIVLAANCGGLFTVIGDVSSLMLWVKGAVTPTEYSLALVLPSLVAVAIPTYFMSRMLPEQLDAVHVLRVYRGDDTTFNRWQRILLLIVGIGGLWFIPTFHRLTLLSPFVGALCVLSLLWIVNEVCNRKLMNADQMTQRRLPHALQYSSLQTILFVIGLSFAVTAIQETGALRIAGEWCSDQIHNIYIFSILMGLLSSVIDNIALVLSTISMYDVLPAKVATDGFSQAFVQDGIYWELISFCSAVGGTLMTIGSTAGFLLMKYEKVSPVWYLRHITPKVLVGWLIGLGVFFLGQLFF